LTLPPEEAAPRILGWIISHENDDGMVRIRLTEVEAYAGERDPASHAYRGLTERNRVMFERPGHLYVYRSYGLHWSANVVAGPSGEAGGVLLRAGQVIEGVEVAKERRGNPAAETQIARGPGNLAQALGLTGADYGADLLSPGHLELEAVATPDIVITQGPRVGVSTASDRPWRFWIAGSPTVSTYRRSPRAES
jgi:DNA-3-methyladenine glycosylase